MWPPSSGSPSVPDDSPTALKPHWFHILVALAARDLHGSGIVRDVLEQTDGSLRLWPATLYGALEEMAADGLIRELMGDDRPEGVSDRRRYYRITVRGRSALEAEASRLATLAGTALKRLQEA